MDGKRIGSFLLALGIGGAVWAAPAPELVIEKKVEREVRSVDRDGIVRFDLEPVEQAQPGDVLVYTLAYRNRGGAPALHVRLEDPVPAGTVLVRESCVGASATALVSVDGKEFADWPRIERRNAGGEIEIVDAPAESVRHVRWNLDRAVEPGASGSTHFKVIVQ